jgi:ribonuclease HI
VKEASFGALLRVNGVTLSRYGAYLGDNTNNEAEYQGVLAVLRHALSSRFTRICIYGDSKLVVQQLNGLWQCKAINLAEFYEQGLGMVRRLREACAPGCFTLAHVYREFNVDADSLANEAIDRRGTTDSLVIDDHWTSFELDAIRFVDDEGDVIMHWFPPLLFT